MGAIDYGAVCLHMPALVYLDSYLFADAEKENGLKVAGAVFENATTMVLRNYNPRSKIPGWILEINGNFREFSLVAVRREWARPFRLIWNLMLAVYSVTPPRKITVGELYDRARGIKDNYPEAPLAADLRRFLKKYPKDQIMTQEILQAWPL